MLCQRGSNFDNVFLVDERRKDKNTTISEPSWAPRRADDDPTLNAGLEALRFLRGSGPVLLRNPIFF